MCLCDFHLEVLNLSSDQNINEGWRQTGRQAHTQIGIEADKKINSFMHIKTFLKDRVFLVEFGNSSMYVL